MRKGAEQRWAKYFELREEGHSVEHAARGAKLDPKTAWRFERREGGSEGIEAAELLGVTSVAGTGIQRALDFEARKALDDFAYFRQRFFGRKATPWQERAAYIVQQRLETQDREYGVINCPPGSGKSTLFTHDIIAWLICKDRGIRVLLGSRTERQARLYVSRLKKTFERSIPMTPDPEEHKKGHAIFAESTLSADYGEFKPPGRTDLWRADALVVQQDSGYQLDDKEPTVSAYGAESGFLGGRFDLVVWDDLVDKKNLSGDAFDKLVEDWTTEYETRLEPGGVLILQGQRMGPDELYRFALDQRMSNGSAKYFHVIYPAHDETKCEDKHDTVKHWPESCLLDPIRIPWKMLDTIRTNTPRVFEIQYQQKDGVGHGELVQSAWIDGGLDSHRVERPGCLDVDRPFGATNIDKHKGWSVVSVDPSPTKYWGISWWIIDPPTYELVELYRRKMGSEEFLSEDADTRILSGLIEEIRVRAVDLGHPIEALIIEINAAQRYLMSQPHVQRWATAHDVSLMPHLTSNVTKNTAEMNLTSISDFFRQGLTRLPYGDEEAKHAVTLLRRELLTWPDGQTDDLVMTTWFALRAATLSYADTSKPPPKFERPSWVRRGRGMMTPVDDELVLPYNVSGRALAQR